MRTQSGGHAGRRVLAKLLDLPPIAAGVVVLFAAMPTGANTYIFAVR
jgi:malonate transporter